MKSVTDAFILVKFTSKCSKTFEGSHPGRVIPKTIIKMVLTASCLACNALGRSFDSVARLS